MFSKNLRYALISLTLLGATGCNQRTILLHPERQISTPRVDSIVQRPITDETLINKYPNQPVRVSVPERVSVPVNTPSLGTAISSNADAHDKNVDADIDNQEMESNRVQSNDYIERMAFPVAEYKRLQKRGTSTVRGNIYAENVNSGEKIMGKKVKMWLNPVTSYSNQWYQEDYLGGYKFTKVDKRIYNYMKLEYSKVDGSFNFSGVPRGDYYLVGSVKCTEACGLGKSKSVRLVKRISVGSGVTNINLVKNVP